MKKVKCELCGYEIDTHQIKKHKAYCNGLGPKCLRIHGHRGGWNKGLTTPEETRKKLSEVLKGKTTGKASTFEKEEERKKKISETMINGRCGGYRKGSGRGKQGWYKSYWCDSSWELAYVIYNLEHGIKFERNNKRFEYTFKNRKYTYSPDFKLDDVYIEIKGYITEQVKEKINQFPDKLIVLREKDMKLYLDYAIEKYGNDFTKLYGK